MSSTERPAATLRLPNALAYAIAALAGATLVILPFALAEAQATCGEAMDQYFLTCIGAAVT